MGQTHETEQEIELMCRLASRDPKKQSNLLNTCVKNNLIDPKRIRPFTDKELNQQKGLFFRNAIKKLLGTNARLDHVEKALGISVFLEDNDVVMLSHSDPSDRKTILAKYFPKGPKLEQLLLSNELSKPEKKLLCIYYKPARDLCEQVALTNEDLQQLKTAAHEHYKEALQPSFEISDPKKRKFGFATRRK